MTLQEALEQERNRFRATHPRSMAAAHDRDRCLLFGAPMNWMQMWPGDVPITIERAKEDQLWDVDGNQYTDFCLGYSAGLSGHGGEAMVKALTEAISKGMVYTLPSALDASVGNLLKERFGQDYWGFALSATDANRFAIKLSRQVTGRKKILVFHGCYHGTVEETFAALDYGRTTTREGQVGAPYGVEQLTTAIEFNDPEALKRELSKGEYACLLMEPVMTNCGILHPQEDFLELAHQLCRETGTLWILDEAHTITEGYKGYAGAHGLSPDILVFGKCLGGGFPVGAYGVTSSLNQRIKQELRVEYADTSGLGGTMTGSVVAMHAIRAALTMEITEAHMEQASQISAYFCDRMTEIFQLYQLPWHVTRQGARADLSFFHQVAQNATESFLQQDHDLYEYIFLGALNRGYLFSPYFHIMATFSYHTTKEGIDGFIDTFCQLMDDFHRRNADKTG